MKAKHLFSQLLATSLMLSMLSFSSLSQANQTSGFSQLKENAKGQVNVYGIFNDISEVKLGEDVIMLGEVETSFNNVNILKLGVSPAFDGINKHPFLELNHLELTHYAENSDVVIGKMVSRIGILDFGSQMNAFNQLRPNFFNEENLNVRYKPSWMLRLDRYIGDSSTHRFIFQPLDKERYHNTLRTSGAVIDSNVASILTSSSNEDVNSLGENIFVPAYNSGGDEPLKAYIRDRMPNPEYALDTSTLGVDLRTTQDNKTYGVFLMNAFSYTPQINVHPAFLNAAANIYDESVLNSLAGKDKAEQQEIIIDYLTGNDIDPVESIENFRYNQITGYLESTLSGFGVRGEFTIKDRVPLLNQSVPMSSIGLGIDHDGALYNNLEMQYYRLHSLDFYAAYVAWLAEVDDFKLGIYDATFSHTLAYATYQTGDPEVASLSQFSLEYKQHTFGLQYLVHSVKALDNHQINFFFKLKLF